MNKINKILKKLLSYILIGCLFSTCLASDKEGQNIYNQLKDEGRTNDEIRQAMKDLGYNPDEYLGKNTNSTIQVITSTDSNSSSGENSKLGWEIVNRLKQEGRTDNEIKQSMEDLGYNSNDYFPYPSSTTYYSSSALSGETYISRSCKPYTIVYIETLNAYTSPDLNGKEYFINTDYLKRYVDSKNVQNAECYTNRDRISSSYTDNYVGSDHYTAPNGKIYFIKNQNGSYTSNELKSPKSFATIEELRNYIKIRNPLISMFENTQTNYSNETHGSATEEYNNSKNYDNLIVYEEEQKLNQSEEAKRQRDITRKTDLAQIQTAIVKSEINNNNWPGMKDGYKATQGTTIAGIAEELINTAGISTIPFDPDKSNTVIGLGNAKGIGEYIYLVTKSNGETNKGFALMAKPETESSANRVVCNGEKNLENGYIMNSTDIKDIQTCSQLVKANKCGRNYEGRSYICYYNDINQLRYLLTY